MTLPKDELIKAREFLLDLRTNAHHKGIHDKQRYLEAGMQALDAQIKACDVPIITERGWAGHFICADRCMFRRNTLIDYGDGKIVVSTVGQMRNRDNLGCDTIGAFNRYYETMAFEAVFEKGYWEADVSKEISFESPWSICELEHETDGKANDMHEAVVKELAARAFHKITGGV